MADETTPPTPPSTNPTAPGSETSEGLWNKIIQIACAVVVVVATALTALQAQFPNVVWVQVAMSAVAGLVSILTQLGYLKSRTLIKTAIISAPASPK